MIPKKGIVADLEMRIRALCVSAPLLPPHRREYVQEEVRKLGEQYYRLTGTYYDITQTGEKE